MGSCTEELWPSFRTSESDGVWKREGTQEELRTEKTVYKHVDPRFKGEFSGFDLPVR